MLRYTVFCKKKKKPTTNHTQAFPSRPKERDAFNFEIPWRTIHAVHFVDISFQSRFLRPGLSHRRGRRGRGLRGLRGPPADGLGLAGVPGGVLEAQGRRQRPKDGAAEGGDAAEDSQGVGALRQCKVKLTMTYFGNMIVLVV